MWSGCLEVPSPIHLALHRALDHCELDLASGLVPWQACAPQLALRLGSNIVAGVRSSSWAEVDVRMY